MIIDFHSHSNASDGALAPEQLLAQAAAAGVEQFAITDHDTVAGYRRALATALPEGLTLRSGVELSCQWAGGTVHVVGLDVDIEQSALVAGLEQLAEARRQRAVTIAQRLDKAGFPGALEGAQQEAGEKQQSA